MRSYALIVVLVLTFWYIRKEDEKIPVGVNGVNHMGMRYGISKYYIDGFYGSNIGREGGGGSHTCCLVLPSVWKPGLHVDLRWEVYDYTEGRTTRYKAKVPVEKYDKPGEIVVHIFRDHSARFVSSNWDVMSPNHPVYWGEGDGGVLASKGQPILEMFSEEELAKYSEGISPRGSWR